MNNLKFRVWHKDSKAMNEVYDLRWRRTGLIAFIEIPDTGGRELEVKVPEEAILMQSTGLKDKNGVEIFEGDLIESNNHEGKNIFKVEKIVDHTGSRFCFNFIDGDTKGTRLSVHCEVIDTGIIIGNIHQTTEKDL